MNQNKLNRQVAEKLGESQGLIGRLGFSLLEKEVPVEDHREPLVMDWDLEDRRRYY